MKKKKNKSPWTAVLIKEISQMKSEFFNKI